MLHVENLRLKCSTSSRSISIVITFFACFINSSVRMPSPGPISITVSVSFTPEALTIFLTMSFEVKKF